MVIGIVPRRLARVMIRRDDEMVTAARFAARSSATSSRRAMAPLRLSRHDADSARNVASSSDTAVGPIGGARMLRNDVRSRRMAATPFVLSARYDVVSSADAAVCG